VRLRALAAALVVAHAPLAVSAQQLVYEAPQAAPASYTKLGWKFGDQLTLGYWYSAAQVLTISQRIDYLEQRAAKECVDTQVQSLRGSWPLWVGIALGAAGGLAGGYFLGKKL
jgi:hypothetical protein